MSKIFPHPGPWMSNFKRTSPPALSNKLWNKQLHRACEKTKSKQKQNQVTSHLKCRSVPLFDLAHKQFYGIIKRWLYCLTPESIGRFFVNNIY